MVSRGGFGNEIEAYGGGFFDRLSNQVSGMPRDTYDYAELQDCRTHLRLCAARIQELESINVDLEARLENQAQEYHKLESDAAESQALWRAQYEKLENECELQSQTNAQLEQQNHKLRDKLLRTERELHGILQKKYDFMELARQEERDRIRAEQALEADFSRASNQNRVQLSRSAPRSPAMQRYNANITRNGEGLSSTTSGRRPPISLADSRSRAARNENPHALAPSDVRRGRVDFCHFFRIWRRHNDDSGLC